MCVCVCVCTVLCLVTQLCPTLCDHMDCSLPGSFVHGDSPDKTTRMDCHALPQRIFPIWGWNTLLLSLMSLLWQAGSLLIWPPGKSHVPLY